MVRRSNGEQKTAADKKWIHRQLKVHDEYPTDVEEEDEEEEEEKEDRDGVFGPNLHRSDNGTIMGEVKGQYPLRQVKGDPKGTVEFTPFAYTDLEGMIRQLPSLTAGSEEWIGAFENLTTGHILALGDIRAILRRSTDVHRAGKMLVEGGIREHMGDAAPFNNHHNNLWVALRRKYPSTPDKSAVSGCKWNRTDPATAYLEKTQIAWRKAFGESHEASIGSESMWRTMVVNGLPESLRNKFEDIAGIEDEDLHGWEKHLRHVMKKHLKQQEQDDEEEKILQRRLLKQQLKEKEEELAERKAGKKAAAKPVVQGTALLEGKI